MEECKVTKYGHFCEPKGPLWSRESVCCLTAVMKLDKGYLSECEVLIKDGSNSDKYLKHKGIYYYSVSKERRFSISCENTSLNKIVNLKGLGSIALEQGCTAMSNGVLLVGMKNNLAKFSMKGLYNTPIHNTMVDMRYAMDRYNISNKFIEFITKLNKSKLNFETAVQMYKNLPILTDKGWGNRGIFGDFTSDIIIMVIILLTATIIIILLSRCPKYCMKGHLFKKILGSQKPEDELKNESVKNIKVLECGHCKKIPLCCNACSKEAVLPN